MIIDARHTDLKDLFINLKEIFGEYYRNDLSLDVMLANQLDANKVAAFASMSGYHICKKPKGEYYIVRITGSACCV